MSDQEQGNLKKRRLWPWITLLVVLVLLGGLRLALRSGLVLDYIRAEAETRVSGMLDGELRIERIEGDLWSHINVRNIRLYSLENSTSPASVDTSSVQNGTLADRQILSLDSLHVSWSVMDLIYRRPLEIRKIHAAGFRADLVQYEDGSWNILEVMPDEEEEEEEEASPFHFLISDIRVTAPEIFVDARAMLPDDPLSIRDLEMQLRLGQDINGFHATLHHLDLLVHESRLDAPVQLTSEASWDGRRVTLDKLLIAGAHTLLDASGSYDTVTFASHLDALLDPLAWRDAAAYVEEYPLHQDVQVRLEAGGSRQDFRAGVFLEAPGLEQLAIRTRWTLMQEPVLTALTAGSGRIDAATLTGVDTLRASIGGFDLALEGVVPLMEWDRITLSGSLNMSDMQFDDYSVDALEMGLEASDGRLLVDMAVHKAAETAAASLDARHWWDDSIEWNVSWAMESLNPGFWAGMEELNGQITMQGTVKGVGYEPGGSSDVQQGSPAAPRDSMAARQDSTAAQKGSPGAPRDSTAAQKGSPGAQKGSPGAQKGSPGAPRDSPAAQKGSPAASPWTAEISLKRLAMPGYPEMSAEITAELTDERLDVAIPAQIDGALLELSAILFHQLEDPRYEATLHVSNLDASVFPGFEQLSTNINGEAELVGSGFDPETMKLNASLTMRESEINGQLFETIALDAEMSEGILFVENARLQSVPATAQLSLRQNIFDLYDLQNRLEFEMELLDLSGFANLAGADTLQVSGHLNGTMMADTLGRLVLESSLNLHSLQLDTVRVEQLEGTATVLLEEKTAFRADIEIRNPSVGHYAIRDISLKTDGLADTTGITGSYDFMFNVESESGLRQQADYHIGDTIRVRTRKLELTDPAGTYTLQRPFEVLLADGLVHIDTLQLVSSLGSELSFGLTKTPALPWEGFISARGTDLGQVQYVFLDNPLFEAVFTGRIGFRLDEDLIEVTGRAEVDAFRWGDAQLDSIRISFDIADHRLLSDAAVWLGGEMLAQTELDLPFVPGEFDDLEDSFFEEPISGFFRINPVDISDYDNLLKEFGMEDMAGIFSMQTTLGGQAGEPEMAGDMRLRDGMVSGVSIDSLMLQWDYDHSQNKLALTSRIQSAGQLAADIQGNLPLYLDFRQLEFNGPDPDDPIDFTIHTSSFNLAALNVFLDPAMLRNLEGLLDADITVKGIFSDPEMDGSLMLSGGQVGLVENNITLRRIRLEAGLSPGQITIGEISAQSVGSFSGSGEIALEGLSPTDLDLDVTATNFRVFNTRDIEIFAGLDMNMTGSIEEPFLKGDVRWERGILYLDDFGQRDVEEVFLDDEDPDVDEGPAFFDRMGMEVVFSVDRNAFVRNRRDPEINLALRGEVDLIKAPFEDFQLFGDMGVSSGHVTTFGKEFQLERGNVLFSGDPMDPELDIRTLYQPRQQYEDIRIYYSITGTLSDPEFDYSSEPEMELQDIISYTLFGRPFHALAGWEQSMSGQSDGNMATNIAIDILLDRIETLASGRLGIDVIEIENTRRGGGGTSIKAGKFISDRLFIAFLQELGGTDAGRQVIIEYLLSRNLELIITAGDDYRSGVDLLWRYDY